MGSNNIWGPIIGLPANCNKSPAPPFTIYRFTFMKGVIKNPCDMNGLADGYCKVFAAEFKDDKKEPIKKKLLFKTPVSKKTLTPNWNGYSNMVVIKKNYKHVILELWDDDLIKDDFIGSTKIKLSKIEPGFPLGGNQVPLDKTGNVAGTVEMLISYCDDNGNNRTNSSNWKDSYKN